MPGRLEGKTCLVTAAAQGIGRAIAEAFVREGAAVLAADLQAEKLEGIGPSDQVTRCTLDATDFDAVHRLAKAHERVSVLVNCVGYVENGALLDCSPEALERSFRINVVSMFNIIHAFLPAMRAGREGSIVNIASVVSSVKAAPERFAYATTKAAVVGLTKAVARDYIGDGIRCNSISPGTVLSPSLRDRMEATGDFDAAHAAFVARQPMGRLGMPEEIAAVALMLASDEARFATGANIIVDGGMSL
jgi:2-dehydro-3-deoxy-L-fuconate 4-dehydrogenase